MNTLTIPAPAYAAAQAAHWRRAAHEQGITPAQAFARIELAAQWQQFAACGTHPHGDRTEEDAA